MFESSKTGMVNKEEADIFELARNIVLRQLTVSAKSRRQLEDKLAARGIPGSVAESVLNRFEDVGLVNDAQYAQAFVRSRAQSRHMARPALRRELQAKGIASDLAEEALQQRTDDDERQDALALVRRKVSVMYSSQQGPMERVTLEKLTRRLVAMLARKGYAPGVACDVVKQVLKEVCAEDGETVWN